VRRRKLAEDERQCQLSVYDAAYLELAQRRQIMLGCKESQLRTAARHAGVSLWA
jgi:predicted nucleic acid-binding protein